MKTNWMASMPRNSPNDGMAHFVFAVKSSGGSRSELSGEISLNKARLIFKLVHMNESELLEFTPEAIKPS